MSAISGPLIPTSGLVVDYDMSNTKKSWQGQPATNLITYSQAYSGGNFMSNWTGNMFNNWINSTVTTGQLAPDGTSTADLLTGYYARYSQTISVTAGATYTFSCWLKNAGLVNPIQLGIATGLNGVVVSAPATTTSVAIASIGEWARYSVSYTIPASGVNQIQCGVDFGASKSANATGYSVYAWGAQCETGSYATPYMPSLGSSGSRSTTQAIQDPSSPRTTFTISSLTYASDNTFSFNGTSDYFSFPYTQSSPNNFTVEAWIYHTAHASDTNIGHCIVTAYTAYNGWIFSLNGTTSLLQLRHHNFSLSNTAYNVAYGTGLSLNTWYHVAATDNGTSVVLYVNGTAVTSGSSATATTNGTITTYVGYFGGGSGTYFAGKIPAIKIYSRALTAAEIQQNFQAMRGRFSI